MAEKAEEKPKQETHQPSPPSASSSPSHEFSFTVSLHNQADQKTAKPPSSLSSAAAVDLSPADDIFFHGHLLPLHLLSHLPVSPRSSTNSMDSFTLPIRDLLDEQQQQQQTPKKPHENYHQLSNNHEMKGGGGGGGGGGGEGGEGRRTKPVSFSLFGGMSRWRKGPETTAMKEKDEKKEGRKRKRRFDLSHALKRYMRMVRPLLLFRGMVRRRRNGNCTNHRQAHSFSGNLSLRHKQELRGRRGEFSAPASMRTSPTNSGILLATGNNYNSSSSSSTSDSTMEELQAAIQAAILHCKNSITKEEQKN